ncbi:hypothetical protein BV22DRAFT_806136 [Leucogyrophana mollusca]|uniref:Uncharacterized protein n=1 Tax=Leucogyrophana mollusca TaxID=85980 RepID=A0ACB8B4D4_9AGAM|nr:hypothetical protein BV22DRAFT_806136 [Leucogyrophana mollusca]
MIISKPPGLLHAVWLFVVKLVHSFTSIFQSSASSPGLPSPAAATRTPKVVSLAGDLHEDTRRRSSLPRQSGAKNTKASASLLGRRATAGDSSRYPRFSKVYVPAKHAARDPELGCFGNAKSSASPAYHPWGSPPPKRSTSESRILVNKAYRNPQVRVHSGRVGVAQPEAPRTCTPPSAVALTPLFHIGDPISFRGPSPATPPCRRVGFAPLPIHRLPTIRRPDTPVLRTAGTDHRNMVLPVVVFPKPAYLSHQSPMTDIVSKRRGFPGHQIEISELLPCLPSPWSPVKVDIALPPNVWMTPEGTLSNRHFSCSLPERLAFSVIDPERTGDRTPVGSSQNSSQSFFDDASSTSSYSDIFDDENQADITGTTDPLEYQMPVKSELETPFVFTPLLDKPDNLSQAARSAVALRSRGGVDVGPLLVEQLSGLPPHATQRTTRDTNRLSTPCLSSMRDASALSLRSSVSSSSINSKPRPAWPSVLRSKPALLEDAVLLDLVSVNAGDIIDGGCEAGWRRI